MLHCYRPPHPPPPPKNFDHTHGKSSNGLACARSKFFFGGGVSKSADRGGGDNSIQVINFGRVGDENFKEWRQKIGGGRVGDNNILT